MDRQDAVVTKEERKRRRRRFWRWLRRTVFMGLLVFALTGSTVPREVIFISAVRGHTAGYEFSLAGWEYRAILDELQRWVTPAPVPADPAAQKRQVLAYLDQAERMHRLRDELTALAARGEQDRGLEQELAELRRQQRAEAPLVEQILAGQISQVLRDEALDWRGQIFPPLTFRLDNLPTLLVVSPRDEIRQRYTLPLEPGLVPAARAALESAIDGDLDVSTLIVDLGGYSTYPSLVVNRASLPALVDIVAHEWAHVYLVFRPLGWNYYRSPELTTVNETVASIVGEEVSAKVMARYYPEFAPAGEPAAEPEELAPPPEPSPLHLALRRIRLRVDELLAQGRVAEAEQFMERERRALVAEGFELRKLNQAYFAFYGAYATSPASVDPTGRQLRALRAQSGSLKAFLDQVGAIASTEDWLAIAPQVQPISGSP